MALKIYKKNELKNKQIILNEVKILNKLKGIDYFSQIISTDLNNYILMDLYSEYNLLDLI
jgi:hypothetical protein